jgi:hypothetical protein
MKHAGRALAVALLAGGCSYYSATDHRVEATKDLFAECTQQYGYDPNRTEALGEHQLGPGELEWRACAYRAVETKMMPGSARPQQFAALIEADRQMTRELASGTLSRSERRAKLEALIAGMLGEEHTAEREANLERARQEMPPPDPYGPNAQFATSQAAMNSQLSALRARLR